MRLGQAKNILRTTFSDFFEDKVLQHSAALAYYAVFSLGPLLILVLSIAGLVMDRETVSKEVEAQFTYLAGRQAGELVAGLLAAPQKEFHGLMTAVGFAILLAGATGVFVQLKTSLNTIWEVKSAPRQGAWGFLRDRLLSFSLVLGIAFLLLVSMIVSTVVAALGGALGRQFGFSGAFVEMLNFVVSFGVNMTLFAFIYRFLPDVSIRWRDVWPGAALAALLFSAGRFALAHYLAREGVITPYGAAGSVVAVLLWVYYSSLIVFFGAEFIQAYTAEMRSPIQPDAHAIPIQKKCAISPASAAARRAGSKEETDLPSTHPHIKPSAGSLVLAAAVALLGGRLLSALGGSGKPSKNSNPGGRS